MDNQTTPPMSTPNPTPAPSPSPLPPTSSPQIVQSSGMGKKLLIAGAVILILALLGGGAYYYMNIYQNNAPQNSAPVTSTYTTSPLPSPTQNPLLEQANQVNEQPVENDLTPVDQNINSMNSASPSPASK